jgi:hypothetical protein
LADQSDRLNEDLDDAKQAVDDARVQLEAAQAEAESADTGVPDGEVDLAAVAFARANRDEFWNLVRRVWLDGDEIPIAVCSDSEDLAGRYETSVADADSAADEQVDKAGQLTDRQRKVIEAAAARQATVSERVRTLRGVEQSLAKVRQQMDAWSTEWHGFAEAAGLPPGLGVPGWRQRAELLAHAGRAAEDLRAVERELDANIQTVAKWDAAAATLAAALGHAIEVSQLEAWFEKIKDDYELAKSNQKVAALHLADRTRAIERAAFLRGEKSTLEESLVNVAAECGVDRNGLNAIVERTVSRDAAVSALDEPASLLSARHTDVTLYDLTAELAGWDRERLSVELESVKDSLRNADEAVIEAQEKAIQAKDAHKELSGRTGADVSGSLQPGYSADPFRQLLCLPRPRRG